MRVLLLLTRAVLIALMGSPAAGADLGARISKGADAGASTFTWTGFYVGGNLGAAFLQSDWSNTDPPGLGTSDATFKRSGAIGGAQIGFSYQHSWFVLGLEADRSWANLTQNEPGCYATTFPALQPLTCSTKADWSANIAVRIGVAWQRWLLYAKIGEAWGHFSYGNICPRCVSTSYSATETRAGRIAAGGLEYAILDNLTVRLEYDFLDFGELTIPFFGNAGDTFNQDISNRVHVIKVGANYLFGWPR
jgi:outer membrane immunogenic protein